MTPCLHVLVLNRPAVLARVAGQVARRGVNIDHFTARNVQSGRTIITIGIDADEQTAERLAKALARLVDVLEVTQRDDVPEEATAAVVGQPTDKSREGERCPRTR